MRIAIVGSGVSGLTAAHLLDRAGHEVRVFESDDHVGGHAHTQDLAVEGGRTVPVDTGFIVCNPLNYPRFLRLLDRLGVATQESDMSLSVWDRQSRAWGGESLATVFRGGNSLDPAHWRMLLDITRFHRLVRELLADGPEESLESWLARHRFGQRFISHYLLPMTGAIWSTPVRAMSGFPVRLMVRFMHHHQMLDPFGSRPIWRTVVGGSRTYVQALTARLRRPVERTAVRRIARTAAGVTVATDAGSAEFDHAVLACHADDALALIADADAREREVLAAFPYRDNRAVLHTDPAWLPADRRLWASWCVRTGGPVDEPLVMSYYMTRLQRLATTRPVSVTLNPDGEPRDAARSMVYRHPSYAPAAAVAQGRWAEISGPRRLHFCGAYWGWGFHEDGVASGCRVARTFQADDLSRREDGGGVAWA
jgi:predicted NAD/FAD-binding protein